MPGSSCVVSHLLGGSKTWMLPKTVNTAHQVCQFLTTVEGCSTESIVLQQGGRILEPWHAVPHDATIIATLSLLGGKGGFGSMLRAIGAQIEKTTNKEACRDLSGRRLRDINQEKKLKEQLQKRAEKEWQRLENRKKKFEALNETPKHIFNDSSFHKEQEEITQSLFDSVEKGLKVAAKEASALNKSNSVNSTSAVESTKCSDESSAIAGESNASSAVTKSLSGSSSDSNGSTSAGPSIADKGVKRKKAEAKKQPAKRGRFFDDLNESSDDDSE
uniref:Protein SDE2 homolog n=2 Tax=Hirondellea gigas TaxID=1518452 RepID=A0A6A7FRD0_9CRUS